MKLIKLSSNQIITLNDYPIRKENILKSYFNKCKLGGKIPFVPVIKKNRVKEYLNNKLLKEFKKFEIKNPKAEYFMLDGSHRTTALTIAGCKIAVIVYETDNDIKEAKKLIATGQVRESGTLNHNFEENCKILNKHFSKKPYFMTVKQKTEKMINEKDIPDYMIKYYKENARKRK